MLRERRLRLHPSLRLALRAGARALELRGRELSLGGTPRSPHRPRAREARANAWTAAALAMSSSARRFARSTASRFAAPAASSSASSAATFARHSGALSVETHSDASALARSATPRARCQRAPPNRSESRKRSERNEQNQQKNRSRDARVHGDGEQRRRRPGGGGGAAAVPRGHADGRRAESVRPSRSGVPPPPRSRSRRTW